MNDPPAAARAASREADLPSGRTSLQRAPFRGLCPRPAAPKEPTDFEDRLRQFMQASDSKLSELRYLEKKGGNRRGGGRRSIVHQTVRTKVRTVFFRKKSASRRRRPVPGEKLQIGELQPKGTIIFHFSQREGGRILPPEKGNPMLIINGTVHTMEGLTIPGGYVAIRGDKIAKVGPMEGVSQGIGRDGSLTPGAAISSPALWTPTAIWGCSGTRWAWRRGRRQ